MGHYLVLRWPNVFSLSRKHFQCSVRNRSICTHSISLLLIINFHISLYAWTASRDELHCFVSFCSLTRRNVLSWRRTDIPLSPRQHTCTRLMSEAKKLSQGCRSGLVLSVNTEWMSNWQISKEIVAKKGKYLPCRVDQEVVKPCWWNEWWSFEMNFIFYSVDREIGWEAGPCSLKLHLNHFSSMDCFLEHKNMQPQAKQNSWDEGSCGVKLDFKWK